MQRIKKTAKIASLEVKTVRNEVVHRGIKAYRATQHATTGVILNRGSCSKGSYVKNSLRSRDNLNIGTTQIQTSSRKIFIAHYACRNADLREQLRDGPVEITEGGVTIPPKKFLQGKLAYE